MSQMLEEDFTEEGGELNLQHDELQEHNNNDTIIKQLSPSSEYIDLNTSTLKPLHRYLLIGFVTFLVLIFFGSLMGVIIKNRKKLRQSGLTFPQPTYTPSDDKLHFLVIGDFGRENDAQRKVANSMGEYCKENDGCDFVVGVGDNIYQSGVESIYDEQFKTKFEDIYNHKALEDLDFYMILGNHDYRNDVKAQILYTQLSKRWKMLDFFYEINKKSRLGGFDLNLLFTDTNPFHFLFFLDPLTNKTVINEQAKRIPEQMEWLKSKLRKPKGDDQWTIVAGHSPVYSASQHYDSQPLIQNFEPLFREYRVPLYLCGHDHQLGWMANREIINSREQTQYIISGAAGGSIYRTIKYNPNLFNYYVGEGGFYSVEVQHDFIFVIALNENGEEIYKFRIDKQ
ncbi:predicted protein [Naegleria gruberi]|uniref:Predicted protein n=1 Tax=Naegleria gruberi TaxID=5762 RepID=D2VXL1_NAEGR|nr:uncharacterized protein NAEGRDRAFT_73787 [Naegleria gruberi]EFC38460.1 predicted protein [Naegleria gruberi]|eukprot:XP_002671204.1 predicted protein [Naegleria gruberi strain NEG-M]